MSMLATCWMPFIRVMNSCIVIATAPIPASWSFQNNWNGFSSDLTEGDLFLSRKSLIAESVKLKAEIFVGSSSIQDIVCDVAPAYGKKRGQEFIRITGFSVFLPFVILPALFIGKLGCKCFLARLQIRLPRANVVNASLSNNSRPSSAMIPQFANNGKTGLNDSTMELSPNVILDENCNNIPRSNDLVCSISLDEYLPQQTLRSYQTVNIISMLSLYIIGYGLIALCRTSSFIVAEDS